MLPDINEPLRTVTVEHWVPATVINDSDQLIAEKITAWQRWIERCSRLGVYPKSDPIIVLDAGLFDGPPGCTHLLRVEGHGVVQNNWRLF